MENGFFKAGKTVGGFIKTLLLPAILSVVMTICTKILSTRMSDIVKDYIEVIKSPLKKGE